MNADPQAQLRLLDLQALDTTLDQLAIRRRGLPEHGQVEALANRLAAVRDDVVRVQTAAADLDRELRRFDGEVEVVRNRMGRDQQRLDAGQVSSPKELESLQSEVGSLHRRQTELEDAELEVMQRREELATRLAALIDERASLERQLADATKRRDAALADIDAATQDTSARREPLAGQIPADLRQLYEKLRASHGGVGAAALYRGRCEGCHLSLSPLDLSAVRAAPVDQVVRCEECQRILVRTPESGS